MEIRANSGLLLAGTMFAPVQGPYEKEATEVLSTEACTQAPGIAMHQDRIHF